MELWLKNRVYCKSTWIFISTSAWAHSQENVVLMYFAGINPLKLSINVRKILPCVTEFLFGVKYPHHACFSISKYKNDSFNQESRNSICAFILTTVIIVKWTMKAFSGRVQNINWNGTNLHFEKKKKTFTETKRPLTSGVLPLEIQV